MGLAEALGKTWDLVVLPGGGPGAAALAASPEVAPHPPFSVLPTSLAMVIMDYLFANPGQIVVDWSGHFGQLSQATQAIQLGHVVVCSYSFVMEQKMKTQVQILKLSRAIHYHVGKEAKIICSSFLQNLIGWQTLGSSREGR